MLTSFNPLPVGMPGATGSFSNCSGRSMLFQSSPGWYAGSYVGTAVGVRRTHDLFQSSPGRYAGSYLRDSDWDMIILDVSILSRLVCRELRAAVRRPRIGGAGFNPLPVGMPGATRSAIIVASGRLEVSILSRLVCRELRPSAIRSGIIAPSFNPLPVGMPGATPLGYPQQV